MNYRQEQPLPAGCRIDLSISWETGDGKHVPKIHQMAIDSHISPGELQDIASKLPHLVAEMIVRIRQAAKE